jgi:thiamine biosynthesis lipoprotein
LIKVKAAAVMVRHAVFVNQPWRAYMAQATRRRVLRITAAATGCLGIGGSRLEPLRHHWEGTALGACASLTLFLPDPAHARRLMRIVMAEIDRLDAIFSLQRSDSAISLLNRDGRLLRPPLDLTAVLEAAAQVSELSGGAFDVTVQPLWRVFAAAGGPEGASTRAVEAAAALIGWRDVEASRAEVAFTRSDMAVTLNGIAQGYITDRVADILRDSGVDHAMVALGEQRALGRRPDGAPWKLGSHLGPILLDNDAVAISGPGGSSPGLDGARAHLLDPRAGRPLDNPSLVAVSFPRAMLADALSTALAVAGGDMWSRIAARHPALHAVRVVSTP